MAAFVKVHAAGRGMNVESRVVDALRAKAGLKADEIAREIGITRTQVYKVLYGPLKGKVAQDRAYRWELVHERPRASDTAPASQQEQFADTDLARLSRYYLACLGYDDAGVSTFLTSKFDVDYIELNSLPSGPEELAETAAARSMLGRKKTERGRYALYLGYPTYICQLKSKKSDWEGFMVEPLLLFPIEDEAGGRLSVDLSYPIINQKPFQKFTSAERDMVMNELVQLEAELGLVGEELQPELDEMAMRLQAVRPEWPWKEDIDPEALANDRPAMQSIEAEGIYNRAVVIMAERSPFTRGLEKELRDLAQLPEERYASTALGNWLLGADTGAQAASAPKHPILEVIPMNTEQREAVRSALSRPVTIITGPPGTGKSQVVTNLLVNAAWAGKRVLFASKNNKAVDVVEMRVNALGPRPILLRVGGQAFHQKLAEFALALMSATTSKGELEEFEEAKRIHEQFIAENELLSYEAGQVIELRNATDRLEQVAEDARSVLGADLFATADEQELHALEDCTTAIEEAVRLAKRDEASLLARLLWPFLRKGRFEQLLAAVGGHGLRLTWVGVSVPSRCEADSDVGQFADLIEGLQHRIDKLRDAIRYKISLKALQSARSLEDIAKSEAATLGRIASHSEKLWKLWLRLQPSRLSPSERNRLGKYVALLKMVAEAGDEGQLSRKAYAEYTKLLREISHLLPCWAVTSLSAKGRIPFEPNLYDLVVFDEASQCDIASALPLLFRAKAVAIIGDQKQLSHISSLQRGQDQALLERFELMEDFPHWAYSHQSLFALGSSHVSGRDIISLIDHHRCHADIINFSNNEFYEERLRVATNYDYLRSPNRDEPGIRWVNVRGRVARPGAGGAVNRDEAGAAVEVLKDLLLHKDYRGSVGVVTPFRAQANAITQLVNSDERLAARLVNQQFLSDTVHKFQGDERDVMIFSPVVSVDTPPGALAFLRSNGNLFNVAITRARAQLIVVGDLVSCGKSDVGYLSRFASYASALREQNEATLEERLAHSTSQYPEVADPEIVSDWERYFYTAAFGAGIRLIPQYPIEKYVADFLLADGERRLVVEIDGERYHRDWTGELCRRDQIRNQRLFELGYDVQRFWVYEVRDDLEDCIQRLRQWLNAEECKRECLDTLKCSTYPVMNPKLSADIGWRIPRQ
ncbi:MAG TPA: AAA domain-containing protein [Sphingomicrobium sp.]|nr:AAA domain-containing protein [Sphingomicrobium sp.]